MVGWYEGAMAQLVAHPTPDRKVRSSILFGLTLFIDLSSNIITQSNGVEYCSGDKRAIIIKVKHLI
jgi:hypothetical protein